MSTVELEPHNHFTGTKVVNHWRDYYNQFGDYAHNMERGARERAAARFVRVKVLTHDKPDPLQTQVRLAVSAMVRSNFVPLDFFSPSIQVHASEERRSIQDLHPPAAAASVTMYTLAWDILRGMEFDNTAPLTLSSDQEVAMDLHLEQLNAAQGAALTNAFTSKVSVIKGPPGTGKTRTIAAIANVALSGNLRVLVIAPGNSASRRILESLVKTGFEEACLVVAESFFFEWHEDAYTAEEQKLGQYVHTKCTFDDHMRGSGTRNAGNRAEDRAAWDFRHRAEQEHDNKWLEVAMGDDKEASSKPVVVIGTHGSIALNGTKGKKPAGSWSWQVQNLLAIQSIDMIIVDETSQVRVAFEDIVVVQKVLHLRTLTLTRLTTPALVRPQFAAARVAALGEAYRAGWRRGPARSIRRRASAPPQVPVRRGHCPSLGASGNAGRDVPPAYAHDRAVVVGDLQGRHRVSAGRGRR
jgi:hypothetical protein